MGNPGRTPKPDAFAALMAAYSEAIGSRKAFPEAQFGLLERFGKLVFAYRDSARAAGKREAYSECADICEQHPLYTGPDCADFIRARAVSEGGAQQTKEEG